MTLRSVCPGRNYNFRCIKFSSHRRSCRKPPDRSGQNLTHVCRFIWEWTSAKQINLSTPRGIWRGLGGHTYANVGNMPRTAGPIGPSFARVCLFIWEWTRAKINQTLDTRWAWGVRGSSIHQSGKASKPLERS